jgi:predicted transcriptional regulator
MIGCDDRNLACGTLIVSTTIGLKLDDDTRARLQRLGATRDRSPHWLMKTAITEFLDREERIEQERLEDEQRWQRWTETGAHIDHDDMAAWLDGLAASADRRAQERQAREDHPIHTADQDQSGERLGTVADETGRWR